MEQTPIILNVDDFGYCKRRDEGILKCFLEGATCSVSLLVNLGSAESGAELINRHKIPCNLHFNITEGKPLSVTAETLTSEDGFFLGKHGLRDKLQQNKINIEEIKEELKLQIQWIRKKINFEGFQLTHIDAHQHINILPQISSIISSTLKSENIKSTRIPFEPNIQNYQWIKDAENFSFLKNVSLQSENTKNDYILNSIIFPDFLGLGLMGYFGSLENIRYCLKEKLKENPKFIEIMMHPGYICTGENCDDFSKSEEREFEMQNLLNIKFWENLKNEFNLKFSTHQIMYQ